MLGLQEAYPSEQNRELTGKALSAGFLKKSSRRKSRNWRFAIVARVTSHEMHPYSLEGSDGESCQIITRGGSPLNKAVGTHQNGACGGNSVGGNKGWVINLMNFEPRD
jgi:hypothetical protein